MGQGHWKAVALATYSTQLAADALFFVDARSGRATAASYNIMCFTFHLISFARGYNNLGALVNIMIQTLYAIRYFILVIIVLIAGFTVSLAIFFNKAGEDAHPTAWQFLFNWDVQLYGGGLSNYSDKKMLRQAARWHQPAAVIVLYEVFKFFVAMLLLNLLIAIMNSVYDDVKSKVSSVLLYEKSRIILDIQTMWLPVMLSRFARPKSYYFPRWLLVLAPASDDDTWRPHHHKRRPGGKVKRE